MDEYSRILIEKNCREHNSADSRRLSGLVKKSYDHSAQGLESDTLFLEKLIRQENDPAM